MEAGWFKSDRNGDLIGKMPIVVCLSFGRRDIADISAWLVRSLMLRSGPARRTVLASLPNGVRYIEGEVSV